MVTMVAIVFVSAASTAEVQYTSSLAFVQHITQNRIAVLCPALVLPETSAGIYRATNNFLLAAETVTTMQQIPESRFVSLTQQRARQAVQITLSLRLRGADAVYVAVAQESGAVLVTWDSEMLARGAGAVTVQTPAAWLAANKGNAI